MYKSKLYLCIGGGGVGNVGGWRAAILAQALDQLGGVAVKVVADICQRDLTAVQILERCIHSLHGSLKGCALLLTSHAGPEQSDPVVMSLVKGL